jgi:isoleucyl-tRNA synthetase
VDEWLEIDRYAWVMTHDLQRILAPSGSGEANPESPGHYGNYEFHLAMQKLQTFCSEDLGGFYLDILKDRLYTTRADSRARRSAQNALHHIAHALTRLLAPVLSFTAQEAWEVLAKGQGSVFEQAWYEFPLPSDADALRSRWSKLRGLRSDVLKQLEELRVAGKIGSSLAGEVELYADRDSREFLKSFGDDLRFVFITSQASVMDPSGLDAAPVRIEVKASPHRKCERCWHYRADVGRDPAHPGLCGRCVANLFGAGEPRAHA